MSQFLNKLQNNVLVADGAIGTIFYSEGLDTCPEAYNLTHPEKVEHIHRSYIEAGADVIQTNTYGANFEKLKAFGLEHKVKEIHKAAVQIAKKAANEDTFILGTVGGFRGVKQDDLSLSSIQYHTEHQIDTLVDEGVDALLFETYYDLEELKGIVISTKRKHHIPIIAQLTASNTNYLVDGTPINDALKQLVECGADIVGLNCHHGPHHMQRSFSHIELPDKAFLSCYPNASLLDIENSEFKYSDNAQYFGDVAQELINEGVRLIGGCCGTTPEHIRYIKTSVKNLRPVTHKNVIPINKKVNRKKDLNFKQSLTSKVKQGPTVIVELDTPKHLDTDQFFNNIGKLDDADIDAVTLADNSLATVRVSNIAAASIIKQRFNIEPLVHITCRDRNLIGLQSHLLGLSLIGVNEILAITGDPSKVGHLPGATNVYDVNSKGLTEIALRFNQGINTDGDALKKHTNFNIAGAFDPNVRKLDGAVKRLEKKVASGMSYFITQPVYSKEKIKQVYEATKHLNTPFFIGIMPIASYNNALFLHNEVPGIKMSEDVLNQFKAVKDDKEKTKELSLRLSKELIDTVHEYFNGLYIITPFQKVDYSLELAAYSKSITTHKEAIL
ncbi:bifunctional homocysteine S-methyltransferase/methylenetetrahydrofolate reductase [Staphylococcus warneri]|jgi:methionine synthase / methylenetetrahydrofolate reductase(NADPH)|uniref:Bifunctional homocysteine S-methyltransferase/methylenetetrahydrofolate reductase n=5 Tax=Bacillati TaxID=1783272 RepID=A0A364USI6_STAWA|nr:MULTISPECIES: bifunctional homocysteine S-methyltransferase/methylenetetrahydrofolate reductase [Staphylococcus]MBJ7884494.1 bifunctional homocysteine S-methyltransferase/methylenetetrahydrofolate reductase [Bacillaceae bacterium HSR45]MBY4091654.1 bifunctional homocysteine S-methyltransferase/methylenetetrahydrofolate reductase [Rhodococcus fascians]SKR56871.1 5-methyltetrahydrofolate--homocysteine methyltransferase [Mycobacteroides abscessus subsp. abscessus]EGG96753.1 bifunctional homocys